MTDLKLSDDQLTEKVQFLAKSAGVPEGGENVDDLELQDVVNSGDEVVGVLPRGMIWDNGLQSFTRVVNVFVVDREGNVLLPVRSMKKRYLPGGYDFSCGENLQAGESYEWAVVRGLAEELGISENGKAKEVGYFFPDENKGYFCFGKVFVFEVQDRDEVVRFNPEEVERLEWKGKVEVMRMLREEPEKFKRDYKGIFELVFEK